MHSSARLVVFAALASSLGGCSLGRAGLAGSTADAAPGVDLGAPQRDGGALVDARPAGDLGVPLADLGVPGVDTGPGAPDLGPPDLGATQPDTGCDPMSAPRCVDANTVGRCVAGALMTETCALGCNAGACAQLVASNVGTRVAFSEGTMAVRIGSENAARPYWVFSTNDGRIVAQNAGGTNVVDVRSAGEGVRNGIAFRLLDPGSSAGGLRLGVFSLGSLEVPAGTGILGVGDNALVLLVAGDVTVDGTIYANGDPTPAANARPGPGGGAGGDGNGADGEGDAPGEGGNGGNGNEDGGGAGGSFQTSGGNGGRGAAAAGGTAAAPTGNTQLVPIVGGSGGGAGADDDAGRGGNAGGALQISARGTIRINATGIVDGSGGGGGGGRTANNTMDSGAGGGGGSGGAVLLEAVTVTIAGRIAVHGGAGGQGARCNRCTDNGANGASGGATTIPAPGSATDRIGGGGGNGSGQTGVADNGLDGPENGGGGGGGAGRIRVLTAAGTETYAGRLLPAVSGSVGMAARQ